jgi:hypothetical protein
MNNGQLRKPCIVEEEVESLEERDLRWANDIQSMAAEIKTYKETVKELLRMLKERHELAMALMYGKCGTVDEIYFKDSVSGNVTLALRANGIEPTVSQKMV